MSYTFTVMPNFKRVLKKKPKELQRAIAECLTRLQDNPRHPGLHTHKMQGVKGVWEAYVDRGNRVTFHYDEDDPNCIVLRNNCNHDMLYRDP